MNVKKECLHEHAPTVKVIDIHTHGFGGYDTRTTAEEHLHTIAELQGSHGVTEILPTIYPATVRVMRENMATVRNAMRRQSYSYGAQSSAPRGEAAPRPSRILGVHLEGPFLNPSRCGALNAMTFIEPTEHTVEELLEGFEDIIKVITLAPELKGAAALIRKIVDRGIIVSMGHTEATYAEAEAGFNAGARGITHIFNAMRGFHHREPGIALFGLLHRDIYIEVIADAYHLHPGTLDLIFRTKDLDHIVIVSDTVRESGTFSGDKDLSDSYGRLLGGATAVTESAKRLIANGFDQEIVMRCITRNPEHYLAG